MAVFFFEASRGEESTDITRTDSGGAVGSGEAAIHIDDSLSKQDALLVIEDLKMAILQDADWLGAE